MAASDGEGSAASPSEATKTKFQSEQLLTDEQILALGIAPHQVEMYRRMAYQRAFGIQKLIGSPLAEYTFATEVVSVSYAQARALYNFVLSRRGDRDGVISDEDTALVAELRQAIDERAQARWPDGQWFAKLDTRSAKDAVLADFDSAALQQALREGMLAIAREQFDLLQANLAFVKVTNRALACRTSADVLHLFELSQRITQDIGRQLDYGSEHFELPIVLREWLDEVCERPQYEFRCFVHDLKLNAITQYFDWMYFPELHARKQELQELMVNFFYERVAPVAPFRSFVIDFYITSDNNVLIIEFNPFHNGAGAGLFSWAKDRERFFNGPLEFRIRDPATEEEPQIDIIPARWTRWFRAELPELFPEPQPEQPEEEESGWCQLL